MFDCDDDFEELNRNEAADYVGDTDSDSVECSACGEVLSLDELEQDDENDDGEPLCEACRDAAGDCRSCGGSGGGMPPMHCGACGGSGVAR